jgi:hypothetical protein
VEIVNNIAVRFECPSDIAQTIRSYIDRSEVLWDKNGVADIIVHWGIDEMQRLSYLTPPSIKVSGSKESVRRQIGMAVPPIAASFLFEAIIKTLEGVKYKSITPNILID